MEDEREEREEQEPSLVERREEQEQEEEREEERPTDYALGRDLTDLRRELDGLKASHADLGSQLQTVAGTLPQAIAEAVEDAIQSLREDSHGEAADETPLPNNPGLKWWEKALGGRN